MVLPGFAHVGVEIGRALEWLDAELPTRA